ncbi:MAG: outer membrane protein assembly factor BamD [Flavobacteriaceae bacterium]|nr:MAG: outer membrane protein assembly factor BamD [Flavobacteriaceae bacterium]
MQKIKNFSIILLAAISLVSCGEYQKVLNKGTKEEQYKLATKLYEQQKFSKSLQLFEKITPAYRGKPQMERIQYMVSQSHYNTKDYTMAAYYFDKFAKNYPKSSKKEEASFMSADSYYLDSPKYSLDQKQTNEALNALQDFIYEYPDSDRLPQANEKIKELTHKLEKKSFEIAKQYYHIGDYRASITSFDNLLSDHLGTSYKEEALFFKLKAAHDLGVKSFYTKKEVRLKEAKKAYEKFNRNFPESSFKKDADKLMKNITKEINLLVALTVEN